MAVDGRPVKLTFSEYELLARLMSRPGHAFNRQELLRSIWGDSAYRDPRAIDVHIRHLREKLEAKPEEPTPDPHRPRPRLPVPGAMTGAGCPRGLRGRLLVAFVAHERADAGGRRGGRARPAAATSCATQSIDNLDASAGGSRPAADRGGPARRPRRRERGRPRDLRQRDASARARAPDRRPRDGRRPDAAAPDSSPRLLLRHRDRAADRAPAGRRARGAPARAR